MTPERGPSPRARRIATLALGWTLVVAGAVLLVLPGPGLVVLLGGLALLGREAAWARRLDLRLRALLRLRRRAPAATPPATPCAQAATPATRCPGAGERDGR